jgi:hypothetical protein
MDFAETLSFYLLVGCGVAVAFYLADDRRSAQQRTVLIATAVLFWPLYLPLLLSRTGERPAAAMNEAEPPRDELAVAIAQVESELDGAFSSLDGWAENVLARERSRLNELRAALCAHADRIREMDALLARVGGGSDAGTGDYSEISNLKSSISDRCRQSEAARTQNLEKLAEVRRQSHADLMATLAWIRELVSMVHLAKFTGAPASRAEELVAQIAAAVEGISAVEGQRPSCSKLDPVTPLIEGLSHGTVSTCQPDH